MSKWGLFILSRSLPCDSTFTQTVHVGYERQSAETSGRPRIVLGIWNKHNSSPKQTESLFYIFWLTENRRFGKKKRSRSFLFPYGVILWNQTHTPSAPFRSKNKKISSPPKPPYVLLFLSGGKGREDPCQTDYVCVCLHVDEYTIDCLLPPDPLGWFFYLLSQQDGSCEDT